MEEPITNMQSKPSPKKTKRKGGASTPTQSKPNPTTSLPVAINQTMISSPGAVQAGRDINIAISNAPIAEKITGHWEKVPEGLKVIIYSNVSLSSPQFIFECDKYIDGISFQEASMTTGKIVGPNHNVAISRIALPAVTPQNPLVLTIRSKEDIHLIRVFKN